MHFVSSDGFNIYVGKNNTQNDYLTLKFANSSDLWFHTKNIHGSHTIIKLGLDKDVPKTTITEAAELAAYYSKGRDSSQVPVDFTQIKNVKKPNGAKPGMVIYDYYNTIYVTPKELKNDYSFSFINFCISSINSLPYLRFFISPTPEIFKNSLSVTGRLRHISRSVES